MIMVIKSSIRLVGNVAGMTEVIMHTKWSLGRPRHRRKDVDSIRLAQQWNKQASCYENGNERSDSTTWVRTSRLAQ
jgi:hypothetical protein